MRAWQTEDAPRRMRRDAIARHRPYSNAPSVPQGKTVSEFEAAMGYKKEKKDGDKITLRHILAECKTLL